MFKSQAEFETWVGEILTRGNMTEQERCLYIEYVGSKPVPAHVPASLPLCQRCPHYNPRQLFDADFPKPFTNTSKDYCKMALPNPDADDIPLDELLSAILTTSDVLEIKKGDGGKQKWILGKRVFNPEFCVPATCPKFAKHVERI